MNILFVDSIAYKPYTCDTLRSEALGGTEATVLRVARGLAKEGLDVSLFQLIDPHREELVIDGIRHVHDSSEVSPNIVVHIRTANLVGAFREAYPEARQLVWMHDLGGAWLDNEGLGWADGLIFVSRFHSEQFKEACGQVGGNDYKASHIIYNPVEVDGLRYPKTPGRLGFFSSPHKGLSQVLMAFQFAKSLNPKLELVVGNPGYIPSQLADTALEGVTFLGELAHHRVMEEMSRCELLFYPQTVFPETFGLVLAEANAMGTPVLCHDMGAAMEVLVNQSHPQGNMVIDCTKPETISRVVDYLIEATSNSAPKRFLDPRFSTEAVITEWKKLLGAK